MYGPKPYLDKIKELADSLIASVNTGIYIQAYIHLKNFYPLKLLLFTRFYFEYVRGPTQSTILRVWFPGCSLFRGNFALVGSLNLVLCPESRSVRSEVVLSIRVTIQYPDTITRTTL